MAENPYIGRIGAAKAPVVTTPDPTPVSAPIDDGAPTMPAAVAGQTTPAANPYEAFLDPKPPTRAVLDAASRTDADAFARSRQLSAETGMPADVIERNMEEVTRRQAVAQADEALAGAPATKRWLDSNPDNVKLSHDVVKQLTATEALVGVLRSATADAVKAVGGSVSGIGEMYNLAGRAIARPVLSALEGLGLSDVAEALNTPAPAWMRPGDALQAVGEPIREVGKAVDIPPEDRTFVHDVAGGTAQVAAQITVHVLTGGAGSLAFMFGQGVDQVTEDVKKEGKQGTVAGDSAAILGGVITGVTEKYGLDMLLKHIPASTRSHIGRILAGAGSEAAQEITEKVLNNITAIVLYDHDRKIIDSDVLYEGGVGGAVGAIVSAAIPGKKAIKARKELEKVVEDIEKSPLNQRAPDKAAEHFAAAMEEQGVETFVSAQKLAENAKPELLAELGLAEKIDAAIERGGDVQISGEAFYRLANEGVMANLLDDVRVGRDAMTSREAEAVPDDLAQQRQLERDMEAQAQAEKDAAAQEPTAPAEATTEAEWKASQWQRRQLIAGGFNQQEIDGMAQQEVLDLVGEKPPSPDKWHGQADEPVALAEEQMGFQAMFATAREAGMTDQQYASYLVAIAEAGEGARKRSEARAIKRQQRQLTAEWNAEREIVRQQVEQSARREPVYAALDSLGVDRMDRNAIVEIMDQESILDILPKSRGRQIFAAKGIHPDVLANQYGFDTGKELIDAIMASVPLKDKIEAETDARMSEKHGAILDKKRDLQEALEDLHNDDQAKILTAELNALRGADKKGALKPELFRRTAKAAMDRLQVKEIHPKLFLDEEVRKGKLAGKLTRGKGKVDGQKLSGPNRAAAAAAKFQQLLNFEYARQAFQVRASVEKMRKQLQKLGNPSKIIDGIDADHRDRILAMLDGFDFSRSRQVGAGVVGDIHYSDMSLGALNTLYENVKQIEQQGRAWNEMVVEGQRKDFEDTRAALIDQIETLPTLDRVARKATGDEKLFDGARKVLAGLGTYVAKIELIVQRLDGGKTAGVWHKALFQPVADAQTAELDLYERTMKSLVEGVAGLPKETRKKLARKQMVPSLGRNMDTSELLMLALNAGNESNLQKVVEGSAKMDGGQAWTEQGVLDALALLGPDEAKWVQKVWDAFEAIRPQVEAVYRSAHGIAPERVQPREIEIGGVKLKGGYFPMMYDRDAQPAPVPGGQSVMDMLENQYEKASVFSGMTKSRSDDYSAPVLLDFSQLAHAMRQPIHFITHFEAVKDVNRLLTDKKINSAIVAKLGPETRDEFQRWLGAVASNNADRSGSSIVNRVFQEIRTNATVAVLGLSYTTALSQTFGLATSVAALGKEEGGKFSARDGAKWMAVGLDAYLANPKEAIKNTVALSGEMRHRLGNSDRDLSQTLGNLTGKVSAFRVMQRASLKAIGAIQFGTVDMPTWLGAYNKALSKDMDERAAVEYADAIVRTSQASGHTKDLAALQRQKGLPQLLTMFTTYTTLLYGLIGQTVGDGKRNPAKIASAASRLVWLLAVPAVADAFLRQEGPPDDEDDEQAKAAWWGLKTLMYGIKSTPLVGQIAGSVAEGYSASLSPVENILGTKIPQAVKSAMKAAQENEDFEITDARKIVDAVGLTIGMPGTTQVVRVLKALEDDEAEFYDYFVTPKKN